MEQDMNTKRARWCGVAAGLLASALLTGCASGEAPSGEAPGGEFPPATVPSTTAAAPAPPLTEATSITISVGDSVVRGTLDANAATADLLAQLPLELSFEDFGGQEKIAVLPAALNLDGMPSGSSADAGTIGYYAPNQGLVLYYDSVGYYPGIIPLGSFEDVDAVRAAQPFTGTVSAE